MPDSRPEPSRPVRSGAPRVAVIGGGATGCGVARDLCLRGFAVTLIEYGDLGSGTSSRFHGMLQSGARYAVSDSGYAAECMRERLAVASLAPEAVETCGGLFVALDDDPADFPDRFLAGCREAAIPVAELDPAGVMAEEPLLSRKVVRAFSVPDATVHSWRLVNLLARDVRRLGGEVLTRHRVTAIEMASGRISALSLAGRDGGARRLEVDAVVNAAGPWSGRVAAMAGGRVSMELTKGSILVLAHRLVSRVINRCRPPSSHDIIAPTGTVSLFGTTSRKVSDPDTTRVEPAEIQELLEGAAPLLPGIRDQRVLRAWAGVRPLVKPESWPEDQPLPRRHALLDHGTEGIAGFYTVCGGSLTTHRSMAEDTADRLCQYLGLNEPCRTAETPLWRPGDGGAAEGWRPARNYAQTEALQEREELLCECEAVSRRSVEALLREEAIETLHDVRRRLRVGFGPCQGSFCGHRLAEMVAEGRPDFAPENELGRFWCERLKGIVHTAWGEQARQALLSDTVHRGLLGLRLTEDMLPQDEPR